MPIVKVKGCGCRYRGQECDHLCDMHKDEFILQKYNADLLLNKMIEEDAQAMDEMNRQLEEQQKDNNS